MFFNTPRQTDSFQAGVFSRFFLSPAFLRVYFKLDHRQWEELTFLREQLEIYALNVRLPVWKTQAFAAAIGQKQYVVGIPLEVGMWVLHDGTFAWTGFVPDTSSAHYLANIEDDRSGPQATKSCQSAQKSACPITPLADTNDIIKAYLCRVIRAWRQRVLFQSDQKRCSYRA